MDNPQETELNWFGILRGHTPSIRVEFCGEKMELNADWVVGFVDGEGCFHISLQKHPEMTSGYQVLPEFVVVQHERDIQVLHALKKFFECGVIRRNHDDRFCYRMRKLESLQKVCEFFIKHPLKTKKQQDLKKFHLILNFMNQGKHLSRKGLLEIIRVIRTMNTKNRPSLEKIRKEIYSDKEMVHAQLETLGLT